MSDEIKTEDTTTTTDVEQPKKPVEKEKETDWVAESRKWESRAKDNLEELNKLKAQAQGVKTLEERVKEIEEENLALKRENIATKHGLPSQIASRLTGKTLQELEADALFYKDFLVTKPEEQKTEDKKQQQPTKKVELKLQGNSAPVSTTGKVASKDDLNKLIQAQKN